VKRSSSILLFLFFSLYHGLAQVAEPHAFTKGVYGDPAVFLENGQTFQSLGINSLFVRSSSLTQELIDAARKENVRVYVEFPTLNGKDYLVDHPEAWPINEKGARAPAADWFMGICLTDPAFKTGTLESDQPNATRSFKTRCNRRGRGNGPAGCTALADRIKR